MNDPRRAPVLHDPDRSVFLADGVVAIAVTLLALDLKPDLPHDASSAQLAHYLREHGSQYFSFLLAFWLIARFWMLHHRTMTGVRELDTTSMWANMLFLFAITCLPLTTYIDGGYSAALATCVFAGNLLLASLAVTLLGDITRRRGLTVEPESVPERTVRRWRGFGASAVPALVVGLAWVTPHAEYFFLLALLSDIPAKLVARRLDRAASSA